MRDPLAPARLHRRCDPTGLGFATTADLPELDEIVGQDRAVEAVAFGIGIRRAGFNLFAMGPEGTGKYTVVRQFLLARARSEPVADDWVYVHDFADPRRPRALRLPAGSGRRLRDALAGLTRELRAVIPAALEAAEVRHRREAVETRLKERRDAALEAVEAKAEKRDLVMLRTPIGVGLAVRRKGQVLDREAVGRLPEAERRAIAAAMEELEHELGDLVQRSFPQWEREARADLARIDEETTRRAVGHLVDDVRAGWRDTPAVLAHLDALEADAVASAPDFVAAAAPRELPAALAARLEDGTSFRRYAANLLVDRADDTGAPVVFEDLPTQPNLVGRVEHAAQFGALVTDHTLVRPGALHRANGGYLVLDARRLLTQPYAWEELKRALRSGEVRIESLGERLGIGATLTLEPEPIPLACKVVLVGDRMLYYLLAEVDPELHELFKVQADFEDDVPRTPGSEARLAHLFGTVAAREGLRPLEAAAAAALVEHAARLAGDGDRLSTHMRRLTDVLREADHLAAREGRPAITAGDVAGTVGAQARRAGRLHERALEEIRDGTILVATAGEAVGCVNGLSVFQLGEVLFGRPSRITARIRVGDGEVVDIEREVALGGPIHSKGVLILAGFVGGRYGRRHPLSLRASLVFEQSYGGVEGDSATLAEACVLLSALGGFPLRQGLAVTGSLNQRGEVQPVGGVNEKIEGFFEVCAARGLDGSQGVVVPAANVHNLMLRPDVVAAAEAGRFHVWPVATIDEALELLTGLPAGEEDPAGAFPEGTVNGRVEAGLAELADRARRFLAAQTGLLEDPGADGGRRSLRPRHPAAPRP